MCAVTPFNLYLRKISGHLPRLLSSPLFSWWSSSCSWGCSTVILFIKQPIFFNPGDFKLYKCRSSSSSPSLSWRELWSFVHLTFPPSIHPADTRLLPLLFISNYQQDDDDLWDWKRNAVGFLALQWLLMRMMAAKASLVVLGEEIFFSLDAGENVERWWGKWWFGKLCCYNQCYRGAGENIGLPGQTIWHISLSRDSWAP